MDRDIVGFEIGLEGAFRVMLEQGTATRLGRSLAKEIARLEGELAVYCFLPDRLIGVAVGGKLEQSLENFRRETAFELERRRPAAGWGEIKINRQENLDTAVGEVVLAPVNEKIVRRPGIYPHIGSYMFDSAELVAAAHRRVPAPR